MVQASGFVWTAKPTDVFPELVTAYQQAIQAGVRAIALKYAPEIQNWMRSNAPWEDRTGNARQGLHAEVEEFVGAVSVLIGHGVTYGIHLELRHSGRYAIINPALDEFAPRIWADVQAMMGH